MKKKPDLTGFGAPPKDPNAFLEGGAAAAAEKREQPTQAAQASAPSEGAKITKTIRMLRSMDLRLKDEAHRRTMAEGKRVTESDLIEQALLKYLNM